MSKASYRTYPPEHLPHRIPPSTCRIRLVALLTIGLVVSACSPQARSAAVPAMPQATAISAPALAGTPLPTRPSYNPGELVDYTAQTGDTLPALAAHFNTTVAEILEANPIVPADATTMPPGLPMKIPIYYLPLWGSPHQIMPDHAFVNGPTVIDFDTQAFVDEHPGWLKDLIAYVGGRNRTGAGVVDYVATNFSVSPRLLPAILEYQAGALSLPAPPAERSPYTLGYIEPYHRGMYLQLVWAANALNNGYYGWRSGGLTSFDLPDGHQIRPDPWQNAASVGIQFYFSRLFTGAKYDRTIGPEGLIKTYTELFGDPWADPTVLIPGSLQQPALRLPFPTGRIWNYTGGPHTGFGNGEPFAAVDFAPPSEHHGCFTPDEQQFAAAMADGVVARSWTGAVVQDLDGDGDERTGWALIYFHIANPDRAKAGQMLKTGDSVGYPSCQGGSATGTHVHIVRKYNGEWIQAYGALAFNLEGWIVYKGARPYLGTLRREGHVVKACECSDLYSQIMAGLNP